MSSCQIEMPRYMLQRKVWALKIKEVINQTIVPENTRYAPFGVSTRYLEENKPVAGGYFVMYEGGYKTFYAADIFETDYKQLGELTQ